MTFSEEQLCMQDLVQKVQAAGMRLPCLSILGDVATMQSAEVIGPWQFCSPLAKCQEIFVIGSKLSLHYDTEIGKAKNPRIPRS